MAAIPARQETIHSPQLIRQYEKFLEYLIQKYDSKEKGNHTYLIGSKLYKVYEPIKTAAQGEHQYLVELAMGAAETKSIFNYLNEPKQREKIQTIEDPGLVLKQLEKIADGFSAYGEKRGTVSHYLETEYLPTIQKINKNDVLVYLVEVFKQIEDETGLIWKKFQLETMFV